MKFGSVCSGIEAASVAWNKLGWSASWLAEIEPFPSAVLAHHYPDVPNLGDMTLLPKKILSGEIEAPDILCGGTPCQAFSIAGNRNSLDDARGNLSLIFCEIANAIDSVRSIPTIIFWENVPGVLNTKDNAFGCFLAGLAGEDGELKPAGKKWTNAGCVFGSKRTVAWRVLDAQYFGLAQRRKRVFVVASARDGFNPAKVLFEFDGLRRDTAPGRNKRETTTTNVEESVGNNDKLTSFTTCSFAQYKEGVGTLKANGGDLGGGSESLITTYNKQRIGEYSTEDVASTCAARDYKDATDLVAYNITFCDANGTRKDRPDGGLYVNETDVTNTLTNAGVGTNVVHPVSCEHFKSVYEMHAQDARVQNVGDVPPTMSATYGSGGGNIPVTYGIQSTVIGRKPENGPQGSGYSEDISFTQTKTDVHGVAHQMAVRRLTPTECERLQGFPDGYTQIPWRNKLAEDCPDEPRYKALGNSWAVPVVAWIGERIAKELLK
jgi:DNA (cytosine-5)-methyltransferase 1